MTSTTMRWASATSWTMISILTLDAKINEHAPKQYQGLDRFAARKQIVADLEAAGLFDESREAQTEGAARRPHRRGDRADAHRPVVRGDEQARPRRQDPSPSRRWNAWLPARSSSIPENWVNTYNQWLNNIQDWCISRQLWWGHQIPAWYGDNGEVFVAHDEAEARQARRPRPATPGNSTATTTCSTPGSLPRCGRSPRWTGKKASRSTRRTLS